MVANSYVLGKALALVPMNWYLDKVRGPTTVLADVWRSSKPPDNLVDYVSGFGHRLYEMRAVAKKKLGNSKRNAATLTKRPSF